MKHLIGPTGDSNKYMYVKVVKAEYFISVNYLVFILNILYSFTAYFELDQFF